MGKFAAMFNGCSNSRSAVVDGPGSPVVVSPIEIQKYIQNGQRKYSFTSEFYLKT